METNFTSLEDPCQREVEIRLSNNELQPHYEEAYKKAGQDIEIKGFRKGKVPLQIIKQRFGRQIEADALEDIASAEFRRVIQENNIQVIGQPVLRDIKREQDSMSFVIRYEIMPEFELAEYKGISVQKPMHSISEEDIDKEVDNICLRSAQLEPAEQITDYVYMAKLKLNELDESTNMPIIGREARTTEVFLDSDQIDPDLREPLLNTRIGDSFSYRPPAPDTENTSPLFRVEVMEIFKVVPAEFTNEFVESITQGQMTTTEELRQNIEQQLRQHWEDEARRAIENQLVDKLVAEHEIKLPESLLHDIMHGMAEDFIKRNAQTPGIEKLDPHSIEHEFQPMAEKAGKWELIRNKIAEKEELEIEESDLQPVIEYYIQQSQLTEQQVRQYIMRTPSILNGILAEKVMNTVIDYAIIDEVQV